MVGRSFGGAGRLGGAARLGSSPLQPPRALVVVPGSFGSGCKGFEPSPRGSRAGGVSGGAASIRPTPHPAHPPAVRYAHPHPQPRPACGWGARASSPAPLLITLLFARYQGPLGVKNVNLS